MAAKAVRRLAESGENAAKHFISGLLGIADFPKFVRAEDPNLAIPAAVLSEKQAGGKTPALRILRLNLSAAAHILEKHRDISLKVFPLFPEIFANMEKFIRQTTGRFAGIGVADGKYYAVIWEKRGKENMLITAWRLPSEEKRRKKKIKAMFSK